MITLTTIGDPSFSLYHLLDPEILSNPYPLYHRLREEDPVHWDPYLHAWVVTRYEDVVHVLRYYNANRSTAPEQLTSMGLPALSPVAQMMVKQTLFPDALAHTRLRALASVAFTPRWVAALCAHIQNVVDTLVDAVQAKGRMEVIEDLGIPCPRS